MASARVREGSACRSPDRVEVSRRGHDGGRDTILDTVRLDLREGEDKVGESRCGQSGYNLMEL